MFSFTSCSTFRRASHALLPVLVKHQDGVIYKGRADLVADPDSYLQEVAIDGPQRTLADACVGMCCV